MADGGVQLWRTYGFVDSSVLVVRWPAGCVRSTSRRGEREARSGLAHGAHPSAAKGRQAAAQGQPSALPALCQAAVYACVGQQAPVLQWA
jgi:hypothetical protein